MTAQDVAATKIVAALNAALEPVTPQAHELDDLQDLLDQDSRPEEYVEVSVGRLPGGSTRMSGGRVTATYLLDTRAVGISVTNVRRLLDLIRPALEGVEVVLDVEDDVRTTRIEFDSGTAPAPDEGLYSALWTWTFDAPV